jgi:hypothetical protein
VTGIKARQFITVKEGQGIIKTETWTTSDTAEPHKQ